jgi:phosphotransferase system enzyme I (PtsI)
MSAAAKPMRAVLTGRCAAPGLAAGRVVRPGGPRRARRVGDPTTEAAALRAALQGARLDLVALQGRLEAGEAADIIGFQIALLDDEALAAPAMEAIARGEPADEAWRAAMDAEAEGYEAAGDDYLAARAGDLRDLRDRVLDALAGEASTRLPPGAIFAGEDVAPSLLLTNDLSGGAILLSRGSVASHAAMLARARGIPMVVGMGALPSAGAEVLVNAATGRVIEAPYDTDRRLHAERARLQEEQDAADALARFRPARTLDGVRIEILLNVTGPTELEGLDPSICDGIGLVRTELLFEGRSLPDEERQFALYARIVRWAAGRPVTFRVLDAGGDKPIAGLTLEGESNPFLGVRGVRLLLRHPEVFETQLAALCRAAALGPVEVMIPMVATPAEMEASERRLDAALAGLAARGVAHARPPLGMMVEVPSAALLPERFPAAFYSIGSNDLSQYVLAAGRDVVELADLARADDPAMLHLVERVVAAGARLGRKVSLCGDAGGDPAVVPALLRAGLRRLSMPPALVGRAKAVIAGLKAGGG